MTKVEVTEGGGESLAAQWSLGSRRGCAMRCAVRYSLSGFRAWLDALTEACTKYTIGMGGR